MGNPDCEVKNIIMNGRIAELESRSKLLYSHLGLQVKTIPAVPEHKEVVKIEPLSSLDGDYSLMAAMDKAAAALKDEYELLDAVVGKAPKSTKKRG